eukprot:5390258-Pyramimonas_sp.AAC.1
MAPGRTSICVNVWLRQGLQGSTRDSIAVGCALGAVWRASRSKVPMLPQATRCAKSWPTSRVACPAGPQRSV